MLQSRTADRWLACPASAADTADQVREPPSATAVECDAALTVAGAILRGEIGQGAEMVGRVAPLGATIGAEEAMHAERYAGIVRNGGGALVGDGTFVLPSGPPIKVCDITVGRPNGKLHLWRMEYGWRVREPRDHPALLLAAIAVLEPDDESATLCLYQPRPNHPEGPFRQWTLSKCMLGIWADKIGRVAAETVDADARAWPGAHCIGCGHRSRCGALRTACYAEEVRDDGRRGGERSPAATIAAELERADLAATAASARLSGLRAEVEARIRGGEWIPGWHLQQGYGRREFTVAPGVAALMTGVEATRVVRRSPAEMEKDGASRSVLAGITRRAVIGAKLTQITSIANIFRGKK